MAFVIVQHLDPTRKGIMPELLQRTTRMKVVQVKDRTKVQPGYPAGFGHKEVAQASVRAQK